MKVSNTLVAVQGVFDGVGNRVYSPTNFPSDNNINPTDAGFKTWTMDPAVVVNNAIIPAPGTLYLVRLFNAATSSMTVSSVTVFVVTAGATLSNVGFALYSTAGALLTSSVNANGATATAFQANLSKTITFTPQVIAANTSFYVGFWFTGTTMPTLSRAGGTAGQSNMGFAGPNFRFATANASLTTTAPASLTTQTAGANAWWLAAG